MSASTTYAAPSATEGPCGPRLMLQADELAQFSEDPPRVTRVFLSPQHRAAGETIAGISKPGGAHSQAAAH